MAAASQHTMILIEPDDAVRTALLTLLSGRGWDVVGRADASELDAMISDSRCDAIISESVLPDRSAADVLEAARQHGVPVIFTGHEQAVQRAVDLVRMGALDFLEKPFPQARLIALLDALSPRQRK